MSINLRVDKSLYLGTFMYIVHIVYAAYSPSGAVKT